MGVAWEGRYYPGPAFLGTSSSFTTVAPRHRQLLGGRKEHVDLVERILDDLGFAAAVRATIHDALHERTFALPCGACRAR